MAKIAAIVQARLGSTRLPLKSLLTLSGMPVVNWVASRLKRASCLDQIIFALPDTKEDEILARHLDKSHIPWIKGPENDVLARFVQAAECSGADYIVRVCADNPLIWWAAVDRLVEFYFNSNADYAYNHMPINNLWPDGLGAEIVSADLLRKLDRMAVLPSQREHCLNYIWDNPDKFKIATFNPQEIWLQRPDLKLDLDTREDFFHLALKNIYPGMDARSIINSFTENKHDNER